MKSISYKQRYFSSQGGQTNFVRIVEIEIVKFAHNKAVKYDPTNKEIKILTDYDINDNPTVYTELEDLQNMRDYIDEVMEHRSEIHALVMLADGREVICSHGAEFMQIINPATPQA